MRRKRHRLNPRGIRKLNHAMHLIAVTQIAHDTPGRFDYDPELAEGKTKKEALRGLKRRVSDAVWRQRQLDISFPCGSGRTPRPQRYVHHQALLRANRARNHAPPTRRLTKRGGSFCNFAFGIAAASGDAFAEY
jgi:hypothetical protein